MFKYIVFSYYGNGAFRFNRPKKLMAPAILHPKSNVTYWLNLL